MINYFEPISAAARYASARPYFHPVVMVRIQKRLVLDDGVSRGLDIGCGAGHSTVALRSLAGQVIGLDRSAAMLAHAPRAPGIHYVRASAEHLPIATGSVALATSAMAFHWFGRAPFLDEARRVLRPGGHLVIYNHAFAAEMRENVDFEGWFAGRYLPRYPAPPRNGAPFGANEARDAGFDWIGDERFETTHDFTLDELIDYLTTQSNVIARVEGGGEPVGETRRWLRREMAPLFAGLESGTFRYRGRIVYLRRPKGDRS